VRLWKIPGIRVDIRARSAEHMQSAEVRTQALERTAGLASNSERLRAALPCQSKSEDKPTSKPPSFESQFGDTDEVTL
jgi:hypothetical protein